MKHTAKELRDVVERYMALLEALDENNRRDVDAMVAMLHPDVAYEIPFLEKPLTLNGRAAMREFFTAAQGMFRDITYDIENWLVDIDKQTVAIEMRSERTVLPDEYRYPNRYVLIFVIHDGLITEFREYLNPIAANSVSEKLDLN